MFSQQIAGAVAGASLSGLDTIARDLWRAWSSGAIDDAEVDAVSRAIEGRRAALRSRAGQSAAGPQKPVLVHPGAVAKTATRFPPRRVQVSPDRARSRERRRRLAASGPMPPALAAKFTTGENAVLAIVAAEVQAHGGCDRSYDELAARAGCCRSLARRAIRLAARFGLLTIELRPRPGRKHLTNVVRILSAEWLTWLRRGVGGTKVHPTDRGSKRLLKVTGWTGGGASKGSEGLAGEGGSPANQQPRREPCINGTRSADRRLRLKD